MHYNQISLPTLACYTMMVELFLQKLFPTIHFIVEDTFFPRTLEKRGL